MNEIDNLEKLLRLCFTSEEHQIFMKHRNFMEGIESGNIKPKTEYEILWFRYKALKKYFEQVTENIKSLNALNELKLREARAEAKQNNPTLINLVAALKEQLNSEKALRVSLEGRLEKYGETFIPIASTITNIDYTCNACGSKSPNTCRCN